MECLSTCGLKAGLLFMGFCSIEPKLLWDAAFTSLLLGPVASIPRNAAYLADGSTRVKALHMIIIPVINKTVDRRVGEERDLVAGVGVERSAPLPSLNASAGPPGDLGDSSSDELVDQGE